MSLLLTRDEYDAIARAIELPSGAFIDGRARRSESGETFETLNPATGEVLNRIASCGQADVDFAVEKARDAFDDGRWAKLHPTERKKCLIKWCKLIRRHRHELAVLESVESGKPIQEIENVDLPETLHSRIITPASSIATTSPTTPTSTASGTEPISTATLTSVAPTRRSLLQPTPATPESESPHPRSSTRGLKPGNQPLHCSE